eukprot:scaffold73634_cov57-Phaeocystis_antarctica.AAC.2
MCKAFTAAARLPLRTCTAVELYRLIVNPQTQTQTRTRTQTCPNPNPLPNQGREKERAAPREDRGPRDGGGALEPGSPPRSSHGAGGARGDPCRARAGRTAHAGPAAPGVPGRAAWPCGCAGTAGRRVRLGSDQSRAHAVRQRQ